MRASRVAWVAATTFVLGVGLSFAVSGHATRAEVPVVPTVKPLATVPVLWAPSGKATIQHLAHGKHAYVGLLRMNANGKVPEHRDGDEEYIHVLEGTGQLTINGRTYALAPGVTVFMPSGAKVSYVNGPKPLLALQVFAGPKSAAKYKSWKARK